MNLNQLLKDLLELQSFDHAENRTPGSEKEIAALRANIPPMVLGHFDRLRARGKLGVIAVRNQVCTGCHMQVPRATVMNLLHAQDIQLCDNCGRYLYLPGAAPTGEKPQAKPPGRKRAPKSKGAGSLAGAA